MKAVVVGFVIILGAVVSVWAATAPVWLVDLSYSQPFWKGIEFRLVDKVGPYPTRELCDVRLKQMMNDFADGVAMVPWDTGVRIARARCFQLPSE